MRSPDAAWVLIRKLATLSSSRRDRFLPVAPDFVIELMPPSDRLRDAQQELTEWMEAGCELGLVWDPGW